MKNGKEAFARSKLLPFCTKMQGGRSPIIKKDGGEMLVAMVLDGLFVEVPSLVCNSFMLVEEILQMTSNYTDSRLTTGIVTTYKPLQLTLLHKQSPSNRWTNMGDP